MAVAAAPLTRVIHTSVPAVAAGSDATTVIAVAPADATAATVTYVPATAVTGAATNNRTLSLVNKGAAGSGTTVIASIIYASGVNATALAENTVTLSGTAANLDVTAGDVLVLTSVHNGTGIADPGGLVRITFDRR